MKRRSFLASLLALPLVVKTITAVTPAKTYKHPWNIVGMAAGNIRKGWYGWISLVGSPVVYRYGKALRDLHKGDIVMAEDFTFGSAPIVVKSRVAIPSNRGPVGINS